MNRRKFIITVSAATVAGTAGCSGGGGGSGNVDTSGPEAIVRSFYDVISSSDADSDVAEVTDALSSVTHNVSPAVESLKQSANESDDSGNSNDGVLVTLR
jgi:hypothetical protein